MGLISAPIQKHAVRVFYCDPRLAEIIDLLNSLHNAPDATDDDRAALATNLDDVLRINDVLASQAKNNNEEQFEKAGDFARIFDESIVDTKDGIMLENDRRTTAVSQLVDALLSNREVLGQVRSANAKRLFKYFNGQEPA